MSIIAPESSFFGRKHILDLLKKRLLGLKEGYRQNIALLGDQFIGKTTLVHKFISDLDDSEVIKIYVDLDNMDLHHIIYKFTGSVLDGYAKSENLPTYTDIKVLTESLKKHIPHTIKEIKKMQSDLNRNRRLDAYKSLLNLADIFTQETGKFCVLFLEEFHNLQDLSISSVFQELGKKIMTQKRVLYVVTSSYPEVAKRILSEKLSLLFGDFEVIMVDSFDLKASREFIEHNLHSVKMGGTLKSFLIDFTGGHPLYLNLLVKEMVKLAAIHNQTDVFSSLLVKAIENTVFDQWGVLSRHFELIVNGICQAKGNQVMASILSALSNNRLKIRELASVIENKKSPLSQKVSRLVENGLVAKNGGFYYLPDKLFRYWVKYVFQKRLQAIDFTPEKLRAEFKTEVHRSIEDFKLNSRKDLSSRIAELFHCFSNEAISLNGRKYKLPSFHDVKSVKLRNATPRSFDAIEATASDGKWLIVMKRESFCENDVHAFLVESKRLGRRPLRCVMISMSDLDQNAKLKALQEKVWIWNENEVNTLLNIFNKPYIV